MKASPPFPSNTRLEIRPGAPRLRFKTRGFSLVEVSLSLGVVAICLTTIFGMLSVTLGMVQDSKHTAEASRLLKQLASGVHGASPMVQSDGSYKYQILGLGEMNKVTWSPGDQVITPVEGMMRASGMTSVNAGQADYAYRLEITPPEDEWSTGVALIRIAWPATAVWDDHQWTKVRGHVRTLVIFRNK